MKGTTKKEGSSWYYVVDLGKGPDGKRIRKKKRGFKTKKEAEAALAKVTNEINTGTYIEPVKMLYKDFLSEHLENKKNSIKKQSHYNYRMIAEAYLNPKFGHLTIQQLNAMVIQRFVNELTNKGLSGAYIKKILDVLNSSLEKARKLEMIAKNPLELVERPRVQRQEMTVWDADEVSLFLNQAQEDRLYIAFLLAITTGMRQGEILGLRWKILILTTIY
ncbi:tyrosine-type recombinase/integrase [Brevibacillus centrosporus]|uniref:tyrosine-type recombinase/integrase n=1 Tax=Brevibacillus centrosporus TaxID=54910 RepID=UPI0037FA9A8B